eukprot:g483.t1
MTRWTKNWNAGLYSVAGRSFHKGKVNERLLKYEKHFMSVVKATPGQEKNILVPLCGKSLDMVHLAARGYNVFGVEGVSRPIEEFSSENDLELTSSEGGQVGSQRPFVVYRSKKVLPYFVPSKTYVGYRPGYVFGKFTVPENPARLGYKIDRPHYFTKDQKDAPPGQIEIGLGDFFQLDENVTGKTFDVVYDRAALVAIRPDQREEYVRVVDSMLKPGGRVLLVTVEHDGFPGGKKGPPYAVTEEDVRTLYNERRYVVKHLERCDDEHLSKKADGGKAQVSVYALTKRKLVRRDSFFEQRHRLSMPTQ